MSEPEFNFSTTHVGSVPHKESAALSEHLASLLDIPCWLQLPLRDFRENIYTQYAPTLPGAVVDYAREKAHIDTNVNFDMALEKFYSSILEDRVEDFALHYDYAQGFFTLVDFLKHHPANWSKGQVMGPISFGLTVTDQDGRACLYNETLVDVLVKHMTMNARWQIQQLKNVSENVILFVDEPYMASFGSAYVSLSREQVIAWLDEVYEALHAEGAITGTHCCGNIDWGVLLNTKVDILNLCETESG